MEELSIKDERQNIMANQEEPLSPVARVFQSPGIDICVVTIVGFKTKINLDVVLDALKQSVSKHPRFSSILSENGAKWIKTEVNVEDHVIVPYIDEEEIGEDGQSFVDDYISRLTMIPLDRSKPLWDIHILNVKTFDAEAVSFIRSHHSLGDATSLMSLILSCTHKTSDSDILMSNSIPSMKRRAMHNHEKKGLFFRSIFTIGSKMRLIWNTVVDMLLLLATILFLKDTKTPLKANGNVRRNPKRFYHRIISLNDIKLIKNSMNMTINDVLMGMTQASFSRYLSRQYDKRNEEDRAFTTPYPSNLPDGIRFRVACAINLRSDIGLKPLADMMVKDSKCRWGNYVSTVFLPFSIGLQTDPLDYLKISKSMMARKKHSYHAALLYLFSVIILKVFGVKVAAVLFDRVVRNTTTCVSNVIGPNEEISFRGHPVAYIALSCYGHSYALLVHFISYADKMIISMAVDPTVIPNPDEICDDMEESIKEIKTSLSERGLL